MNPTSNPGSSQYDQEQLDREKIMENKEKDHSVFAPVSVSTGLGGGYTAPSVHAGSWVQSNGAKSGGGNIAAPQHSTYSMSSSSTSAVEKQKQSLLGYSGPAESEDPTKKVMAVAPKSSPLGVHSNYKPSSGTSLFR